MRMPDQVNVCWAMNFVIDQLANGHRFRVLNVVDVFSRESVLQVVDFSISGQCLACELVWLDERRPLPTTIVCDNGLEQTSIATFFWSRNSDMKLHFIQPGKPIQNAFVENFNGKFREYCLDLHWSTTLEETRSTIDA
jgi:putative transposase